MISKHSKSFLKILGIQPRYDSYESHKIFDCEGCAIKCNFKSYAAISGDEYESLRMEVIHFIPYIVLDDITSKKRLLNSHIEIFHVAKNKIKT